MLHCSKIERRKSHHHQTGAQRGLALAAHKTMPAGRKNAGARITESQ